jgi:hypothetical protein
MDLSLLQVDWEIFIDPIMRHDKFKDIKEIDLTNSIIDDNLIKTFNEYSIF